jgi:ABC-2 type transport system permease protein
MVESESVRETGNGRLPGTGHRVWTGVRAHGTAFFREPLYLVLLVLLPIIEIKFAGSALESLPTVAFPEMEASLLTTGRLFGAIYATAVFAGIVGLFQRLSAEETDRRLIIAGSSPARMFLTRLLTVLGITLVVTTVSTGGLLLYTDVANPGLAFGALALAGVLYAFVGVLLGSILSSELAGSLALVFVVDVDVILATGLLPTDSVIGEIFPLYRPYQLLETAILGGDVGTGYLVPIGATIVVLGAAAAVVYGRTAGVNGGGN